MSDRIRGDLKEGIATLNLRHCPHRKNNTTIWGNDCIGGLPRGVGMVDEGHGFVFRNIFTDGLQRLKQT
jgi:hypothetical protein